MRKPQCLLQLFPCFAVSCLRDEHIGEGEECHRRTQHRIRQPNVILQLAMEGRLGGRELSTIP